MSPQPTGPAGFEECTKDFVTSQLFAMSEEGAVMGDESVCLDCPQWEERDAGVRFAACRYGAVRCGMVVWYGMV